MSATKKRRRARRKAEATELGLTMPEYTAMERQLKQTEEEHAWEQSTREREEDAD
jgi:hypothetical protein